MLYNFPRATMIANPDQLPKSFFTLRLSQRLRGINSLLLNHFHLRHLRPFRQFLLHFKWHRCKISMVL